MNRYILLASFLMLFAACKKDKKEPDMRPRWHVNNNDGYSTELNYRFYRNLDDYANGTNAFISIRLPWGTDTGVAIDQDILDNGRFYLDVYSDDFMRTNWVSERIEIPTAYLFENSLTSQLFEIRQTTTRARYIGGNERKQVWQAINAYSVWTADMEFNERL